MLATAAAELGGLGGFLIGVFVLGFVWLIVAIGRSNIEVNHRHESFQCGYLYSTATAHRIIGTVVERVMDGKYVAVINSLWRTYPDTHGEYRYFLLKVDELKPPAIQPVVPEKAKEFIREIVTSDFSNSLIKDWFETKKVSTYA